MNKHRLLIVAGLVAIAAMMAAGTGSAGKPWPVPAKPLNVRLHGPVVVVVGRNVTYKLVVNNSEKVTLRAVKVSMTPATLIVKSASRFKKVRGFYAPELSATWRLSNLRPGTSRTIKLTLKFPAARKGDFQGYGVKLEAQALYGASGFDHQLVTVHYARGV